VPQAAELGEKIIAKKIDKPTLWWPDVLAENGVEHDKPKYKYKFDYKGSGTRFWLNTIEEQEPKERRCS
jgi:hypothetical protein